MKIWSIIILLILTFLLRWPSLSEPYWYGDEGVTLTVSQTINRGAILYKDIDDNKPPLLYFLGAAVGDELKNFKVLTLVWSLFTIAIFYFLSKLILGKRLTFLSSLIFTLLANTPILEGNIINGEIYFILPTISAAYLILHYSSNQKISLQNPASHFPLPTSVLYLIGFVSSLGFLIKVPALMDFLAMVLFLIFISPIFSLSLFKKLVILCLGFLTPLLLSTCYFLLNHAFFQFLNGAFLNNFAYSFAWQTKWLTPNQYLFLKVFVLIIVFLFLFIKRKNLSPQIIFLTLWFIFSLFGCLLSSRPYPHYVIQVLPSLTLISVYLISRKKVFSTFYFLLSTFYFLLVLWYQFNPNSGAFYQNSLAYYQNYFLYQTSKISQQQYVDSFDPQVSLTYSLANFLQKNTKVSEKVFIWSDNPLVYALSNRQPVGHLITAYYINSLPNGQTQTISALKQAQPKFVIITLPEKKFSELNQLIKNNYVLIKKMAGAEIYKIRNGS